MNYALAIMAVLASLWAPYTLAAPSLSVEPAAPLQGDPLVITAKAGAPLLSITFDGEHLPLFSYAGETRAIAGIPLSHATGTFPVTAKFRDGEAAEGTVTILARAKPEVAVSIPQKLGGNTPASERRLLASIAAENKALKGAKRAQEQFWADPFFPPLARLAVTNPYGYEVQTGASAVAHLGADLEAARGTPVMAMNRGIVRIARTYRVYGETVLIDHGAGIQTLYLHLSKISVREGEFVDQGKVIGLSGETGYAEGPHLHLSVWVNGVSVDPLEFLVSFLKLFLTRS